MLRLQSLNRFFYDIAISRVKSKFCIPIWHYFVRFTRENFKNKIFRVKSTANVAEFITDIRLDFEFCRWSVMLNSELYCYGMSLDINHEGNISAVFEFTKISNIDFEEERTFTLLARPNFFDHDPAVVVYKRSHLFKTGGSDDDDERSVRVEVYNVDRNHWSPCTNLNIARTEHSSCIVGGKLYVSGGVNDEDSIEVADCSDLIKG